MGAARWHGLGGLVILVLSPWIARSAAAEPYGADGRFDHDLALSLGVGGALQLGGASVDGGDGDPRALGTAEARLLYLHTAGVVVGATYAPEASDHVAGTLAVELRPLFLVSFAKDQYAGGSVLDLVRDSIGLEAGVRWDGERPAFLLGLGTEVPLVRSRDSGLFLRLGARLLFPRTDWVGGEGKRTVVELGLALQGHTAVSAGLL